MSDTMYGSFAQVYDLFMDNVPYEDWKNYILRELKKEKIDDGLILDLGCGTGRMTRLLSYAGYDMIGVDMSEDMLMIARDASAQREEHILYLLQDMREFELYGTVRAVISVCDSMNYIMEEDELLTVFSLVNNYLDPGGLFLFDLNTVYKYEELLAENTICENRDEGSFIWENYYDSRERVNEYDLTLFIREEDDLYRKYEEVHYQRAYPIETVKKLLSQAGMEFVGVYDVETGGAVRADSEKVYFVAREYKKQHMQ